MTETFYFVDQPHKLQERIKRTFARHPELAQASISVTVDQQRLTLQGVVASYYLKQVAQESLKKLLPEFRIQNEMTVAACCMQ